MGQNTVFSLHVKSPQVCTLYQEKKKKLRPLHVRDVPVINQILAMNII